MFQRFIAELWSQTAAAQKAGKTVDDAVADKAWMSKYPGYDSTRLQGGGSGDLRRAQRKVAERRAHILVSLVVGGGAERGTRGGAQSAGRRYVGADGAIRVALGKQPFSPNGPSKGPTTMADGGIQKILADLGADGARRGGAAHRRARRRSTAAGSGSAWRSATSPTSSRRTSATATSPSACWRRARRCPAWWPACSAPGPTREPLRIGMLWLDAHPDFNTPETTRSGSLGGMPVAVATGRALQVMRLDAKLDPPLSDRHVVMGGVRLTDPLEQHLLDDSMIEQLSVDDLRDDDAGGVGAARSPQPDHRQALHPHRHGRARSARGHGPRQQGARRPVERGSWRGCSRRSSRATQRRRRSASRRSRRPTKAGCRSPRSTG